MTTPTTPQPEALTEREQFERWFAAATFESLGSDWQWAAWQARAALAAAAPTQPTKEN